MCCRLQNLRRRQVGSVKPAVFPACSQRGAGDDWQIFLWRCNRIFPYRARQTTRLDERAAFEARRRLLCVRRSRAFMPIRRCATRCWKPKWWPPRIATSTKSCITSRGVRDAVALDADYLQNFVRERSISPAKDETFVQLEFNKRFRDEVDRRYGSSFH